MASVECDKSSPDTEKAEKSPETSENVKNNLKELTEEQTKFLVECEEEFANRYTDDDPLYVESTKIRDLVRKKPPIFEPWYTKPPRKRDYDRDRRNYFRDDRHHKHAGRRHMHQRSSRPY